MPICPICDDTGLQNSDSAHPEFCYCSAGKQARRQWEASHAGSQRKGQPKPASFIDISHLEEVNASVDAMRASLLGSATDEASIQTTDAAGSEAKYRPVSLCWYVMLLALVVALAETVVASDYMGTQREDA